MPDLSLKSSHEYWSSYPDSTIYRVISFMESSEQWTLDGDDELESALNELGQAMDEVGETELQEEDRFVYIASYIRTSRMLRLMQGLDSQNPGSASKLLMHAEMTTQSTNDIAGLFLRRNIVFERLRLLSRVFSPSRFELVRSALEGDIE
jgi:intracellular multiplication protein IcmW